MGQCISASAYELQESAVVEKVPFVKQQPKNVCDKRGTVCYLFDLLDKQGGQKAPGIFAVKTHAAEQNGADSMVLNKEVVSVSTFTNAYVTAGAIKRQMKLMRINLASDFYTLDPKNDVSLARFWQGLLTEERELLQCTIHRLKPYANAKTTLSHADVAEILISNMIQRSDEPASLQLLEMEIRFFVALLEKNEEEAANGEIIQK